MKKYRDLSINVKVPLMMGIAGLVVFSLVCLLLMVPLRRTSLEDSANLAQTSAVASSEMLAGKINGIASVIRSYAGLIENVVSSDIFDDDMKRDFIIEDLMTILEHEHSLSNIWCIFEPNAVDGLDSLFRGMPGSSADGRFTPYVSNAGVSAASLDMVRTPLYEIPRREGRETISEPYNVSTERGETSVFSISIPIKLDGRFIGVIGTRYDIRELNNLIASVNTYGDGKLVTDRGIIAVYHDPERVGILAERGNREILDRLPEGRMFEGFYELDGHKQYKVYIPINLGIGNKPWFFAIDVPQEVVYQNAQKTVKSLVIYCIIGVVLIALAGWLLITTMLKGVTNVTSLIQQLSLGKINLQINDNHDKDEIGTMQKELGHLVEGLQNTANFAADIGKGNLDAEYSLLSDDDMLGNALLSMRESLQKAQIEQDIRAKEEEQRNWGTAGLAKFAEILRRDNTNLETLSYNVISSMVKYIGANQGGIFLLNEAENESDRVLEMKACYAFDRRKFDEKQVIPGEGLVGTCFLEGELIYITDVPNEYINITSGLGDANPKAVLICPLKVNDQIYGVIELASFKPFEPYQIDFIQKECESIASTISSVRVNIRTEHLLQQTKLQAEEMANTEEELRQNMEEMQATQEEMRRRETELQDALARMQELQHDEVKHDEMHDEYNHF